jgi:flagellar protein FlaF
MSSEMPFTPSAAVPSPAVDPRQIEGWALLEIAQRLEAVRAEPVDEAALLQVVHLNWRLWTIFQTSLLDPDCPLAVEIRNNILSLANFIDKHSADIIADPLPSKLDVLIGINRELAAGLMAAPLGS